MIGIRRKCLILVLIACTNHTYGRELASFQVQVDRLREQYGFPGMSVDFIFDDGRSGSAQSGFANLDLGIPLSNRPRMPGASTGKSFVGAMLVSLQMEGKLTLDEPISKWLGHYDWFKHLPNHSQITLRHLLNHSSGISDHVHQQSFQEAFALRPEELFSPHELIQFILDQAPLFAPGSAWAYSDTGYILIGLIIEQITKRPYYELVQEKYLVPLGLKDTLPANNRRIEKLSTGYIHPSNPLGLPATSIDAKGLLVWHPATEWTGGGLITTSYDLALWGSKLLNRKWLPSEFYTEQLRGVPIASSQSSIQYGAGLVLYGESKFGASYGHYGWIPGYVSSFRYYTDYGVCIAFQINSDINIYDNDDDVLDKLNKTLIKTVIKH